MNARDFRMLRRDNRATIAALLAARRIRSDKRLQRAAQHPAGMRIELRADGAAHGADRFQSGSRADDGAADEIAVAADIFGQRIERQIGAMLERRLEHRPEQRVVAAENRTLRP